jgi:hypothetical protein
MAYTLNTRIHVPSSKHGVINIHISALTIERNIRHYRFTKYVLTCVSCVCECVRERGRERLMYTYTYIVMRIVTGQN